MKGIPAIAIIVLVASCCWSAAAHAEPWRPPNAAETSLIILSLALVEADVVQTVHARMTMPNFRERNPLLGERPSPARIILQNGVAGGFLTVGLGYFLPPPWRSVFSIAVIGVESVVIATNF